MQPPPKPPSASSSFPGPSLFAVKQERKQERGFPISGSFRFGEPAAVNDSIAQPSSSTPKRTIDTSTVDNTSGASASKKPRSEGAEGEGAGPSGKAVSPFDDPKADFEIISKEGNRYKVHSCHLLSHSPYFRDLQLAGDMISPLNLPSIPHTTISDILTLMTHQPLAWVMTDKSFVNRTTQLVDLCKQWKCEFLLERVSAMIDTAVGQTNHNRLIVFCCAVAIGKPKICRRALPHAAAITWSLGANTNPGPGQTSLHAAEAGHSFLDIIAMPRWLIGILPLDHRIALGRAYRMRGEGTSGGVGDWAKVADEYYRLITEATVPVP